jgi:hypothetical protein
MIAAPVVAVAQDYTAVVAVARQDLTVTPAAVAVVGQTMMGALTLSRQTRVEHPRARLDKVASSRPSMIFKRRPKISKSSAKQTPQLRLTGTRRRYYPK